MRNYEKECPYCGSCLSGGTLSRKEDGNFVEVRSSIYWCSSEDCCGKLGITRRFQLDNDGFLVECDVEDVETREVLDPYSPNYEEDEDNQDLRKIKGIEKGKLIYE